MLIERLLKIALLGSEWVLYLLVLLSVVSIATMVERWVYFIRRGGDVEKLGLALGTRLEVADVAGAYQLLEQSRTVPARIAREALRWLGKGPDAMTDAVDAEVGRVRSELERGTNLLGTLGNNAPFVGLFGTVLGVIISFSALGEAGQNTEAMGGVMAGIAESLVATGVGLFVALPAVVAYNLIQKRIGDIETEAGTLVKLISAYAKGDRAVVEGARVLAHSLSAVKRSAEEALNDATFGKGRALRTRDDDEQDDGELGEAGSFASSAGAE